jgi:hypothetical protein
VAWVADGSKQVSEGALNEPTIQVGFVVGNSVLFCDDCFVPHSLNFDAQGEPPFKCGVAELKSDAAKVPFQRRWLVKAVVKFAERIPLAETNDAPRFKGFVPKSCNRLRQLIKQPREKVVEVNSMLNENATTLLFVPKPMVWRQTFAAGEIDKPNLPHQAQFPRVNEFFQLLVKWMVTHDVVDYGASSVALNCGDNLVGFFQTQSQRLFKEQVLAVLSSSNGNLGVSVRRS